MTCVIIMSQINKDFFESSRLGGAKRVKKKDRGEMKIAKYEEESQPIAVILLVVFYYLFNFVVGDSIMVDFNLDPVVRVAGGR